MDFLALAKYLPDVLNAIKLAQLAIQAGRDAIPHIMQAYEIAFKGKVLTDAERAASRLQEDEYSATIQAPLHD